MTNRLRVKELTLGVLLTVIVGSFSSTVAEQLSDSHDPQRGSLAALPPLRLYLMVVIELDELLEITYEVLIHLFLVHRQYEVMK